MIMNLMRWTCVLAWAAAALTAQTATPVRPIETLRTSGMVGIAEGQTARLNLLNPGVTGPAATAAMCSAAVSFIDAQGTVLKSGTVTVIPGQSLHFDLDGDADLKLAVNERHEIRATVQIPPVLPPTGSAVPTFATCRLIPTLEIFDTLTGRTTTIQGAAHFVVEPIPVASN